MPSNGKGCDAMGKADSAIKGFMSDPENFADLINMGLFGEPVVAASELRPMDSAMGLSLHRDGEKKVTGRVERIVDDLRLAQIVMGDGAATYVVLGAEYQMLPHQAMPVRCLLDYGLAYADQVLTLGRKNREGEPPRDSAAFLSGLLPGDRLNPVVIVVLYLGGEPWTAPLRLSDMLTAKDEKILRHSLDCKVNLVTPERIAQFAGRHDSQLWKTMRAISEAHRGREALRAAMEEKTFEQMTNEAVRLINTVLGTQIPLNHKEGGYVNMTNALREMEIELDDYRSRLKDYQGQVKDYQSQVKQKDAEMERLRQEIAMLRGLARA